jgi:hypothetical protein
MRTLLFLSLFLMNFAYGSIRPAKGDEVDILYNLIRELAEYEKKDLSTLPLARENLQHFGFGENPCFLTEFAEVDGEVVGYAIYTQVTSKFGILALRKPRDQTIVNRPILLILTCLRSFDRGSFLFAKNQILRLLEYIFTFFQAIWASLYCMWRTSICGPNIGGAAWASLF